MRADGVVVPSPGFDQDTGFGQRVEDLAVEQFVAHRAVEGLRVRRMSSPFHSSFPRALNSWPTPSRSLAPSPWTIPPGTKFASVSDDVTPGKAARRCQPSRLVRDTANVLSNLSLISGMSTATAASTRLKRPTVNCPLAPNVDAGSRVTTLIAPPMVLRPNRVPCGP